MAIRVRVHRKFAARVDLSRLRRIAQRALKAERQTGDVTVYVTTDAEIRALNKKFHATDAATDVLAFTYLLVRGDKSSASAYLGDVVISYERARAQAHRAGWTIRDELDLLAAHGVLHLSGYTDETPHARERMWKRKESILAKNLRQVGSR